MVSPCLQNHSRFLQKSLTKDDFSNLYFAQLNREDVQLQYTDRNLSFKYIVYCHFLLLVL